MKNCPNKLKEPKLHQYKQCKLCRQEEGRRFREKNKEKIKKYYDQYKIKNKEYYLNYNRNYSKNNKLKLRNKYLKYTYNITLEQYNEMVLKQNNSCAICNKFNVKLKRTLCVDHCHKTGKVRELLCDLCNKAIGLAQEDPELLRKMISYLEKHKKAGE